MRDFFIGTIALALGAGAVAVALFLAFEVVPGAIARMNPIHCSAMFVALMILPFSKWIGQGIVSALRSRSR